MAKQLYDYWFVQFDFPNEEGKPYKSSGGTMVWNEKLKRFIPKGWESTTLGNECHMYQPKTLGLSELDEAAKYKVYGANGVIGKYHTYNHENSEIAMACRGNSCGTVNRTAPFSWITGNAMVIKMIDGSIHNEYIKQALQYANVDGAISGSGQPQLTRENLNSIKLCKPTRELIIRFSEQVSNIVEMYLQNESNIEELTKQRDELLPLLMNGQVSVNSDLSASYIIYKNKIIRIMKENIIQAIVAKMQRDLDCRQMARLKAVLTSELHNVEIIEKSDCATQQTQENEHLLNSFISAKKIEGCSDKTLTYYRNTIERLLVTLSLAICHITTTDIRTYLSDYQEEHQSSKVTIDNMRRIFSSFFAWLEDEDYIAKSPVRRIHKVKTDSLVKEVLSDEQLEQLRDSCTTKRDLAIIDFLSSTGIRVGELVKLSREDIDFHERQCVVFGKGNKERVVYFNARTKLHLQQYLNERTDSNPALFVSLNSPHSRLTISGVEVRIRKMGQALSMPKVHPHKFRRTLATMAIDKGMPIEQVQRLLGHVRIDTTLHYAIVNQNNVKLAHKKYLG